VPAYYPPGESAGNTADDQEYDEMHLLSSLLKSCRLD
jgi:hypothetical protein